MIRTEAAPRTELFDQLALARRFEEEVRRLQLSSTIEGAVHLATGHEAVSVGVGAAGRSEDWVARTDLMTAAPIAERTRGIGITTEVVDGMDVRAMASAADSALEAVRSGRGPRFLEAETYRFVPHSRSDPVTYQPEEEVERWRARD